jgi:DNA-directed RNA polymerase specialized sigma24 family protein
MADIPPFDDVLRQALAGVHNDDVLLFYQYFDELKGVARRNLHGKARSLPGESAVVQSALLSMFCDTAVQQIPLADVDEYGYPMLWPLLLKYIERHCNRWNKHYQAKKRKRAEVPFGSGRARDEASMAFEPADYRAGAANEEEFGAACDRLYAQLSDEERLVMEARLRDLTLAEIARLIGRSESTVTNRLNRIRALLETM